MVPYSCDTINGPGSQFEHFYEILLSPRPYENMKLRVSPPGLGYDNIIVSTTITPTQKGDTKMNYIGVDCHITSLDFAVVNEKGPGFSGLNK